MSEIPIKPISSLPEVTPEVRKPSELAGTSFSETLKEAIQEVNDLQNRSSEEIGQALKGELTDVHSAMLALQKADLSFQLMLQVRNKLVQAYRDVMRMQG
jgi:flagellar hook-basal body complex protein FliE